MTDENFTEIAVVIDKSSSMSRIWEEAVSSYNDFIKDQQGEPGRAKVSLALFDTQYLLLHDGVDLQEVPRLSNIEHPTGGMTAMNDAICTMIDSLGARLSKLPEAQRPGRVIVVIITDGQENSSKENTDVDVKQRVDTQRKDFNWQFMFMSSDPTARQQSTSYGIPADMSAQLSKGGDGYVGAVRGMSQNAREIRSRGVAGQSLQCSVDESVSQLNLSEEEKKRREKLKQL